MPTDLQLPQINLPVVYPLAVLVVVGCVMLLLDAFVPKVKGGAFAAVSVLALMLSGGMLVFATSIPGLPLSRWPQQAFGGMLIFDRMTVLASLIIFASAIFTVLLSHDYLRTVDVPAREYYTLVVFAALSMVLLCASHDLITLFVSLEMLSLCLYVLVAINRRSQASQEGALKYFLLGSAASAFLLLGIAYVWGVTGTTNLAQIRLELIVPLGAGGNRWLLLAGALLMIGFAFKLALVPFHQWVPEAYQGAPTPVTAFLATGSKAAGVVALLHVFQSLSGWELAADFTLPVLTALAVVTIVAGNVLAVVQTNIKRLLAYSSVAHSGYMLVGVLVFALNAGGHPALAARALDAVLFYLFAYTALNMVAFGVASALAPWGDSEIANLGGLVYRRGGLAAAMSVAMFGLTGIPFTVGFSAKFYVFGAAVDAGFIPLVVMAFLASVISAYYYLRVVVVMTMAAEPAEWGGGAQRQADGAACVGRPVGHGAVPATSGASLFVIGFCTAVSFVFFFFPESFLRLFV
ncbi:MAG: NADH-quinone oxidoreductase subunit N [Candidatus Sumerlaeia bacterium]